VLIFDDATDNSKLAPFLWLTVYLIRNYERNGQSDKKGLLWQYRAMHYCIAGKNYDVKTCCVTNQIKSNLFCDTKKQKYQWKNV